MQCEKRGWAEGNRALAHRIRLVVIALIAVAGAISAQLAAVQADQAGPSYVAGGASVRRIVMVVNKSRTLSVGRAFSRALVGGTEFVDVLPLNEHSIYIQAKKVGATNVSLVDPDGRLVAVIDLEIVLDTSNLQASLHSNPGAQGIHVSSAGSQMVLSGVAADAVSADRAVQVAKSLSGNNEVVNAMQIAPSQQVMLEVRFLEANREAGRKLGVNWFGANASGTRGVNTGLGATPGVLPPYNVQTASPTIDPRTNPGAIPILGTAGTLIGQGAVAPFGTILANVLSKNGVTADVLITALETKGLVRRLAEPNLIALSGDKAQFLAGGEFPVPVASSPVPGALPTVTIVFKEFGVRLNFVPTVLAHGLINLNIKPEVSELDFTNAVTISGTVIPSLTKRSLETTVELRDGQSFALAGLLQATNTRDIAQLPWIGSVPVLGTLFRSAAFQQDETDLVVIVTPRLVAPAVPGQRLASPLDSRLPSNDVDFFLNGQPEQRKLYQDYVSSGGAVKGPYGHMIDYEVGPAPRVAR
jgi:pilus assembly protein CpaC